jgi:hypothetical protein
VPIMEKQKPFSSAPSAHGYTVPSIDSTTNGYAHDTNESLWVTAIHHVTKFRALLQTWIIGVW